MFLVVFETPAGYALFKVLDEGILNGDEELMVIAFRTPDEAKAVVELVDFESFGEVNHAVDSILVDNLSMISEPMEKLLKKINSDPTPILIVTDKQLGQEIADKFQIEFLFNSSTQELMRCIRSQINGLISSSAMSGELMERRMNDMSSVLAQSLGHRKLQFNPDMVDSMIKYAITTHDDLEKGLEVYIKRMRLWYDKHFPELRSLVPDDTTYIKTMSLLWHRCNVDNTDFSSVLTPDVETKVKFAAYNSTGEEINPPEFPLLNDLADVIVETLESKAALESYLEQRMSALAPNVTALVGSLIAARLVAEAGSLLKLSKKPASAISLFGAGKALFAALRKGTGATPKHGYLFNSRFVQEAETVKNRGKISRALACKIALAARIDSFTEHDENPESSPNPSLKFTDFARISVAKIEARLKRLNDEVLYRIEKDKYKPAPVTVTFLPGTAPVPDGTVKLSPITILKNSGNSRYHQTQAKAKASTNNFVKNSNNKQNSGFPKRWRRPVASNKREYEKLVRNSIANNNAGGSQIPRRGGKRRYSAAFPINDLVSDNLFQIEPQQSRYFNFDEQAPPPVFRNPEIFQNPNVPLQPLPVFRNPEFVPMQMQWIQPQPHPWDLDFTF